MSVAVSVCIFRIELNCVYSVDAEKQTVPCGAMAAESDKFHFSRGRREMRDITIETYSSDTGETRPLGLIPGSESTESAALPLASVEDPKSRWSCEPDCMDPGFKTREQMNFVSGNPFVEVTKGILHLYKENELTPMDRAAQRSQTVCILAVPATMTCHDLLTFTAACHGDIQHLRIIRDGSPNRYMALLTFRSQQSASEFYSSFNGVPYNSLEPDCCCHLVFVSRVELLREGEGGSVAPLAHTELPTCPVCLERMDESVDGILTILCNHSFHSSCLAKWGDTSCPVCRYVQTPELVADNRCFECHSAESLWICLICGHVGCGRYVHGHAYQHYHETQHCYSMQLGNNRVWDYVGDNFVHRLLQNKGDGKLVEGSPPGKQQCDDEKMDSVQLEFTYLLTSQLDSQRLYFEDKLARVEQQTLAEVAELQEKISKAVEENKKLQEKLLLLSREKQAADKKLQHVMGRLSMAQSELQDERQMNHALQQNQSAWQSKFQALEKQFNECRIDKDKELADVREQLRDVMFFLEAQKQISESADRDEIAEGRIVIGESAQPSPTPTGSGRKDRRRRHR
ncbi:BRCA1-associated protein [Cryptotermes secundus]|uniref:BRCA1-associated protein n=1 Tax=Cryptotermes secundus TaxID=105785 RepID=A0A2J7PX41_9NEOP|nr:BRCA1-associated protein isoform X2 [Cryptotermes secundus]PNF20905.1 BRCA1-associated protein [Cryptotermes secundus]